MKKNGWILVSIFVGLAAAGDLQAEALVPVGAKAVSVRYAAGGEAAEKGEVPDFQKHISPLFGRLGCNGRACHGSFQGQGGFRLSLFGYDLEEDYKSLTSGEQPRVDKDLPESSLVLQKPMLLCRHKGGKLITEGSWEHELLLRWLEAGAKPSANPPLKLKKLEVQPSEIRFSQKDESVRLKVIAHWKDGTVEDVTPLCRYTSRDTSIAQVDGEGVLTVKDAGDTHIVVAYDSDVTPVSVLLPYRESNPSDYVAVPAPTQIDKLVLAKQQELGILPSGTCDDAEFLRRVSLDLTGTLPAPSEVEAFLADSSEDKRSRKIDELLERPSYAAWWATKFSDMTGNNAARMIERQATRQFSQQWYDWIRVRVEQNVPYDQIVKGIMLGTSRDPGESYEAYQERMSSYNRKKDPVDYATRDNLPQYWARLNMKNPDDKAMSVAHNFLGLKIQCAQCHKHPFDTWTQEEFKQFSEFFKPIQTTGTMPDGKEIYREQREQFKRNQKLEAETINKGDIFPWQEVYIAMNGGNNKKKQEKTAEEKTKPEQAKATEKKADADNKTDTEKKSNTGKKADDTAKPEPEADTQPAEKQAKEQKPVAKKSDEKQETTESKPADEAKSADEKPVDPKAAARLKKRMEQAKKRQEQKKKQAQAEQKPKGTFATLPGEEPVELKKGEDPRKIIVKWMLDRKNPRLARALVNRVWASHLGVGIVEPVDDLALGNPPSNQPLLDYLTDQLIQHDYDMKWLHREILNSRTYQLSWQTNDTNKHDTRNFSHALPRRLPAEVAYDAVQQALVASKKLEVVDENLDLRSIMSTAGQNAKGRAGYALMVFGRPQKATNCDCERSSEPSLLQTIYLHNDQDLINALQQSPWMQELQKEFAGDAFKDETYTKMQSQMKKLSQSQNKGQKALNQAEKKADQELVDKLKKEQKETQEQISELQKRINRHRANAKIGPESVAMESKDSLIREGYLRTLSRLPSDDELKRCREHLSDGDDFVGNMRDMMWALLNTKEFIVNH